MEFSIIEVKSQLDQETIKNFFQKLVTNDVFTSDYVYTLLLTPRGKYVSDFFIAYIDEKIFLEIPSALKNITLEKLNLYKIGLLIDFVETDYVTLYSKNNFFFNSVACDSSISDSSTFSSTISNSIEFFYTKKDPRNPNLGYRICFDKKFLNIDLYKQSIEEYLEDKYKYELVDTLDLNEKSTVAKYNLKYAISTKKGCYIGQEIIARARQASLESKYKIKLFEIKNFDDIMNSLVNSSLPNNSSSSSNYSINYLVTPNQHLAPEIFNFFILNKISIDARLNSSANSSNYGQRNDNKTKDFTQNKRNDYFEFNDNDYQTHFPYNSNDFSNDVSDHSFNQNDINHKNNNDHISQIKNQSKEFIQNHKLSKYFEDIINLGHKNNVMIIGDAESLYPDMITINNEEKSGEILSLYIKNKKNIGLCLIQAEDLEKRYLIKIGDEVFKIKFLKS